MRRGCVKCWIQDHFQELHFFLFFLVLSLAEICVTGVYFCVCGRCVFRIVDRMGSQCLRSRPVSWTVCPSPTSCPRITAIPGRSLALRPGLSASTRRPPAHAARQLALISLHFLLSFCSFLFPFIINYLETCCKKKKKKMTKICCPMDFLLKVSSCCGKWQCSRL